MLTCLRINTLCRLPGFHSGENSDCSSLAYASSTADAQESFGRTCFLHLRGQGRLQEHAIDPLNAELNPICHLLALLAHLILHVSRIRVKVTDRH
jgi:hypothetical protein